MNYYLFINNIAYSVVDNDTPKLVMQESVNQIKEGLETLKRIQTNNILVQIKDHTGQVICTAL